jgi:predicted metalloprotease with PDZ domain
VTGADGVPHELDLASDSAAALELKPDFVAAYKKLVDQSGKLFDGVRHYRGYHFLMTLSDHVAHFGLEHHESNDSRLPERSFVNEELRNREGGFLGHEFFHSWNGKYRRPARTATPEYQTPMQGDLLWVYEGLTTYYGPVLGTRAGMLTPERYRAGLAETAAALDHRPGRSWRNLQDTADAAPASYFSPDAWASWRRGTDFYDEDWLNWLWVDVIIRQQTGGTKSLDDFCRIFHGGQNTPPKVVPYEFTDVVAALNQVTPYDWKGFWTERLTSHGPGAPLGGIEASGWKLTYSDKPGEMADKEGVYAAVYSLGLYLDKGGNVHDTIEGMVAAKAGMGPGMKVIAVNGRRFTDQVLKDALAAAKSSKDPIDLLVENVEYYKTFRLDYHDGERYPQLTRDESKPDLLTPTIVALP